MINTQIYDYCEINDRYTNFTLFPQINENYTFSLNKVFKGFNLTFDIKN